MNRTIVTLVMLLMLALQGAVSAGAQADESNEAGIEHCNDHAKAGPGCHCCDEAGSMEIGCATLCSAVCAGPLQCLIVPHLATTQHAGFSEHWMPSPIYSPPNPPPIS